MAVDHYDSGTVPELGHPEGHPHMCSRQVVTALDAAAINARPFRIKDYRTNLAEVVVDHEAATITFVLQIAEVS